MRSHSSFLLRCVVRVFHLTLGGDCESHGSVQTGYVQDRHWNRQKWITGEGGGNRHEFILVVGCVGDAVSITDIGRGITVQFDEASHAVEPLIRDPLFDYAAGICSIGIWQKRCFVGLIVIQDPAETVRNTHGQKVDHGKEEADKDNAEGWSEFCYG